MIAKPYLARNLGMNEVVVTQNITISIALYYRALFKPNAASGLSLTVRSFLQECAMADRRRNNGPPSGTAIPVFTPSKVEGEIPQRTRKPNQLRRICALTQLPSFQTLI